MIYRTQWIPAIQSSLSPTHFLLNSLAFHSMYLASRALRPKRRSAATVQNNYDSERARLLARLDSIDWATYAIFPAENRDFMVINDQIRWGVLREARQLLLDRLVETVRKKVRPGQTVIEFGSGDGRNLLYLRKIFPEIRFIGLELSPVSVEVSKKAAEKFGISGVEFYQSNVCESLPAALTGADIGLIFTSFALEQMPRIFRSAIAHMLELSPSSIVLFEPVPEVWGNDLRAQVARLRVHAIDRLRHLPSTVSELLKTYPNYTLTSLQRSGLAINPHTEMCEVVIERKA